MKKKVDLPFRSWDDLPVGKSRYADDRIALVLLYVLSLTVYIVLPLLLIFNPENWSKYVISWVWLNIVHAFLALSQEGILEAYKKDE